MRQDDALIEFQNATLWRGNTCVFPDLNLRIDPGERLAILGPNGSGKTTLLKSINREIYPVKKPGSFVRILGRENWNVWELRQHIGLLSQDLQQRYPQDALAIEVVLSGFHSSIGVHGNIAERVNDEQRQAAVTLLEELGMQGCEDTPLRRLSTGQQRRCLLARALVHRPHTLILDEPTAGLDLAASFDFLRRLRQLEGCNIILVTHQLNEIPPEVPRVVLLHEGRVAADGPKEEVLTAERLSAVFGTRVGVATVDGHYLAYPDDR